MTAKNTKQTKQAANTAFNTIGTVFYFACQYLLTILVVRIGGFEDAGIFAMVLSITNIFSCVALFGLRNFQVSDVRDEYTDLNYLHARIVTITLSLLLFAIVVPFLHLNAYTLWCTVIYLLYKYGETISDLCFSYYQKKNTYRSILVSLILKGILVLISFVVVLMLTHSLFMTLVANTVVYYALIAVYDLPILRRLISFKGNARESWKKSLQILKQCWPLMIYACLVPYLNFVTRYSIEGSYGEDILGGYSSITIVFSVLNTLMNSVFVTIVPEISKLYLEGKKRSIFKKVMAMTLALFVMTLLGIGAAKLLGTPVFVLLYGKGIKEYIYLLIPTVIASCVLTFNTFYSTVLISFRRIPIVLVSCLAACIATTVILPVFVKQFQLLGPVYALIAALVLSSCIGLAGIFATLGKRKAASC